MSKSLTTDWQEWLDTQEEGDLPAERVFKAGWNAGWGNLDEHREARIKDLERQICEFREHISAIYDISHGWYGP